MDIILDTNILRQDFALRANKFDALFSYLRRTSSNLLIPDVVFREAESLFRRELQSQVDKTRAASERLARIAFIDSTKISLHCDIEAEVRAYREFLWCPRGFNRSYFLKADPKFLDETIDRLIYAKKPASSAGKEFRDIVIWLTIKDYLALHSESYAFISANTREFAAEGGSGLAVELQTEIAELPSKLFYFTSVEQFLKEKASEVDFVDLDWVQSAIPDKVLADLVLPELRFQDSPFEAYAEKSVSSYTGYISVQDVSATLDDFFVYDMFDDGLYLNLTYSADVEIEAGMQKFGASAEAGMREERQQSLLDGIEWTKTLHPKVFLSMSAKIVDHKIVDLELDDWELA